MSMCPCYGGESITKNLSPDEDSFVHVQDSVTAKRNLTKYSSLDTTFSSTREAKFVNILIDAMEGGDQEMFTAAVYEFDQVMKLDNWKTNILLKIKRGINEEPSIT